MLRYWGDSLQMFFWARQCSQLCLLLSAGSVFLPGLMARWAGLFGSPTLSISGHLSWVIRLGKVKKLLEYSLSPFPLIGKTL